MRHSDSRTTLQTSSHIIGDGHRRAVVSLAQSVLGNMSTLLANQAKMIANLLGQRCKWQIAGSRRRPESRHLWRERRRRSVDQCRVRTQRVIYHPPFFDHGKPIKTLSNDQQLPVRWREVKKSLSNFPSPKTLRSSVNPKKGIKSTARSAIREKVPLRVPPPTAVMLSPKDCP